MQNNELFNISSRNLEWLKENYESLKKEYDGLWVVIQDRKVVSSASTFDEIIKTVRRCDPNKILVEYMQSEPVAMFF
jgi:SET domain-containing protein